MNPLEFDTQDHETGSTRLNPKDLVNHLLMIWSISYIPHSPTQYNNGSDPDKPADVIVVDVVDLDGVDPETGQVGVVSRKTWWRQGRLIQDLKTRIGNPKPRIARLSRVGSGASAPYELVNMAADPSAVVRANNWWNSVGGFTPSTPTFPGGDRSVPASSPTPMPARPEPSPLEQQARATLTQNATLDRLRQMSQNHPVPSAGQSEQPPF